MIKSASSDRENEGRNILHLIPSERFKFEPTNAEESNIIYIKAIA